MRRALRRKLDDEARARHRAQVVPVVGLGRPLTERERNLYFWRRSSFVPAIEAYGQISYLARSAKEFSR